MFVLKGESVVYYDCDDTLVIWDVSRDKIDETMQFNYYGTIKVLLPHKRHIALLKEQKKNGKMVVVWTAAGWEWAQEVVKVLELEPHVDVILSKPTAYVDDLDAKEFMGHRIFLKE